MARRRPATRALFVSAAAAITLPLLAVGGTASSAAVTHAAATTTVNCTPTGGAPVGPIPGGTYANLALNGPCGTDGGPVTVTGNLTLNSPTAAHPNTAIVDMFASSSLTVHGNVIVQPGATAFIGCENPANPCLDNSSGTSRGVIGGDLLATKPLGVIIHATTIGGDAAILGGGGSTNCNVPVGFFATLGGPPQYSDFEDSTIHGNVWEVGIHSCWLGSLRNNIGGSITVANNVMGDPDAMEVLTNNIAGNDVCYNNSPVVGFGFDSGGVASHVAGAAVGECAFSVRRPDQLPNGPRRAVSVPITSPQGYVLGGQDGGAFAFGTGFYGSAPGTAEILPYAAIASTPGGHGYYLVNGSGHVVGFGPNARNFGDAASLTLASPIAGASAAPSGDGYWLVGGDGGVFGYGPGAPFKGGASSLHLAKPIAGICAAPDGLGYVLAGADGGAFAFGSGRFHGSLAGIHLAAPIVGIAVDPVTGGYWMVGSDGGVFGLGAPFFGSASTLHLAQPIVGIVAAPHGDGYYLIAKDGGVFAFGPGTRFQGSASTFHLAQPVDGMALG